MSEKNDGQNNPDITKAGAAGATSSANTAIMVAGGVAAVAIVATAAVLIVNKPADQVANNPDQEEMREVLVNDDNVEDVAELLEEETQEFTTPGRYTATMNFEWHFTSGDAESYDSYVANASENTNDVYFDVTLDGEEEPIYKSPIIPVGAELKNIRLNRKLEAGEYNSVLDYHLVDENQKSLGTASFTVKIIIEN
jgi:hypothetical protein